MTMGAGAAWAVPAVSNVQMTQRAGSRMMKTLAWYETLGHACRVLDVVRRYAALA